MGLVTKEKRLTEKEYQYIFRRVPRVCVDLLIVKGDGFILTKRDIEPNRGAWHLPGGRLLIKETIKKAITRIAKSEVGLTVSPEAKLIGYAEMPNDGPFIHSVSLIFKVTALSGHLSGSWQAREVKFFRRLPSPVLPQHSEFLKKYLNRA